MSFDYNQFQFTKAELANFLNKYGDNLTSINKPYQMILEDKINKTFDEIDKLNKENSLLTKELLKATGGRMITISMEIDKNHRKWEKLNLELDKLTEQLYKR